MAVLVDIAEAVVATLNGDEFKARAAALGFAFTAARSYRPLFDREEMKDLHVTVVPGGFTVEALDRRHSQGDYTVEVAIQQAPEPLEPAMDALMGLVEGIAAFFTFQRLGTYPQAMCVRTALAAGCERGYAPEHVDQLRQFTSVLALTFRVAG